MKVPLHFVNSEVAPGVKLAGGVVSHLITEAEVLCLPGALPEFIEVDLSNLEAGQTIHLSDLALPAGVEFASLSRGEDHGVANILAIRGGAAVEETAA
jgi:large subunit ribosomal protein L25